MKRTLVKFKNNRFLKFIGRHEKYAPVVFFIGGFIFDTLTLGRIDRAYDLTVLSLHMSLLSITLYLFNLVDDGKWENTFLERYQAYFPLAIQFFFGGLSSAYVIYFSRSVSLTKTASFFVILVAVLLANEFLKKRISNKYLQFSVYAFLSFTFFSFMIPVIFNVMNTKVFVISGLVSFACTLCLLLFIYWSSASTRAEIHLGKLLGFVLAIYFSISAFYYFNLIPPVPIALETGLVAHSVKKQNNKYLVSYQKDNSLMFWKDYHQEFFYKPNQKVYVFSSIFAPSDLKKTITHKWNWFNETTEEWEVLDSISYDITGGRHDGFRGYTYKSNVKPGKWKVEVVTNEALIVGVIDFEIIPSPSSKAIPLTEKAF
ncbi:DUF2914 domain-containing protein [Tamlana crocina]|uniref:DUF2914 domain-containing protein n=1 Tax=Tamlana crocina TaxID=393006 RepID=A0ABX1DEA1_9FLAO|nr:DUF2914 domain-containing protein [Tamlana crocina]NJX16665.1 DUF2914 domain-containing protein [Tamlana crocina]